MIRPFVGSLVADPCKAGARDDPEPQEKNDEPGREDREDDLHALTIRQSPRSRCRDHGKDGLSARTGRD
jgi:hypothetical protein